METVKLIITYSIIIAIGFVIIMIVDRIRYNKMLNSCDNWIPLNMIPTPTRVIHYCKNNLENIRYTTGDIFILEKYEYNEFKMKADLIYKYYIAFGIGNIVELSEAQIKRIETIYNMKIRESN